MTEIPSPLATLIDWARWYVSNRPAGRHQRVLLSGDAAQLVLDLHDSHAAKLRAEIVELAVTWRNANGQMATTIAEEELMAAVDALAIAEKETP